MSITFREAIIEDSKIIGSLVIALTAEICERSNAKHFDINLNETIQRCENLMRDGHYAAMIASYKGVDVAIVTMSETYALYALGKIGVIQEFYVCPDYRSTGVGSLLAEQIKAYGKLHDWSCIELCTPPLPEFERTLSFYQKNGLIPVGGRKMRLSI